MKTINPLGLTQQYTKIYYNRGLVYSKLNDYEQAIINYDKSIELDPDFPLSYYRRGLAWRELGHVDKAIADLEQYLALAPQDPVADKVIQLLQELRDNTTSTSVDEL